MISDACTVKRPDSLRSCVVFASPHSGRDYLYSFLQQTLLDETQIRSSEDAFVDHLFNCCTEFGASFIAATAPRAFLDLNRASDELDPAVIEGIRRRGHNPRVASGLGVIPRVVSNGQAIYSGKITLEEAQARIENYWQPYHDKLQMLLDEAWRLHGQAVLLDCHSMPHEAMDGIARKGMSRPNVVLGDRFGASAGGEVVERVEAAFTREGFNVTRNTPFAGAYVTQAYGRPSRGQHAVQIEIDRALYMDEARIVPNNDYSDVRAALQRVIGEVTKIGQERMPLAAE